ncbi:MAG: hypothetical protein ACI8TQ_002020 [Planctomycetota bacterium]|jgi:hypothetical protein
METIEPRANGCLDGSRRGISMGTEGRGKTCSRIST